MEVVPSLKISESDHIEENIDLKKVQVISVISTKGGVGKSTLSAALAAFLTNLKLKILLVDGDIQPSVSNFYETHSESVNNYGLAEFILDDDIDPLDCVSHTVWGSLSVIKSNDAGLDSSIAKKNSNCLKLKKRLNVLRPHFDYIIIDSPGSANKLTESVSIAGDLIISPVEPSEIAASELRRTTLEHLEEASILIPKMPPIKYFVNKRNNSNGSKEITEELKNLDFKDFDLDVSYVDSPFSNYACYSDASKLKRPVHLDDKRAFRQLADFTIQILPELEQNIIELEGGK